MWRSVRNVEQKLFFHTSSEFQASFFNPVETYCRKFSVDVFEEKARLLQWLDFFRQFNAIRFERPFLAS